MVADLNWLDITWTGAMVTQSERLPAYRQAFDRLLREGWVYPCRCSRKVLGTLGGRGAGDVPGQCDKCHFAVMTFRTVASAWIAA